MENSKMKEMVAIATHAELIRMLRLFRGTERLWEFLQSLFELPYEVWGKKHLQADYLAEELWPKEKEWLLNKYWNSAELKQNPLITILLLEKQEKK